MAVIEECEDEAGESRQQARSTPSGSAAGGPSGVAPPASEREAAAPPLPADSTPQAGSGAPPEGERPGSSEPSGQERLRASPQEGNGAHIEAAVEADGKGAQPEARSSQTPRGEGKEKGGGEAEADGYETASDGGDDAGAGEDDFHDALTEEEQRKRALAHAEEEKAEGNALYIRGAYDEALQSYERALKLAAGLPDAAEKLAVYHSNSAICHIQLGNWEEAVKSSAEALKLNPTYVKALVRHAQACEHLDRPDDALADLKKVVEIEPQNKQAIASVRRLEPIVAEKQEKMKEEMLGKLKDLGNSLLGHFGMSVDNFKAVKDPATGSYSINFQK